MDFGPVGGGRRILSEDAKCPGEADNNLRMLGKSVFLIIPKGMKAR
jgi:hypothetical protein